jgi:hypothetical protein
VICRDLTELYATNSGITTLEGFTTASNLVVLDLSHNVLSTVSLGGWFSKARACQVPRQWDHEFHRERSAPEPGSAELSENLITNVDCGLCLVKITEADDQPDFQMGSQAHGRGWQVSS